MAKVNFKPSWVIYHISSDKRLASHNRDLSKHFI